MKGVYMHEENDLRTEKSLGINKGHIIEPESGNPDARKIPFVDKKSATTHNNLGKLPSSFDKVVEKLGKKVKTKKQQFEEVLSEASSWIKKEQRVKNSPNFSIGNFDVGVIILHDQILFSVAENKSTSYEFEKHPDKFPELKEDYSGEIPDILTVANRILSILEDEDSMNPIIEELKQFAKD